MNQNYVSILSGGETASCCCRTSVRPVSEAKNTYTGQNGETILLHDTVYGAAHEVFTEIVNKTDKPLYYSQVSSAYVEIENKGELPWSAPDKYRVHFCRSCWLGEGQWQTRTLAELGVYENNCGHPDRFFAAFSSVGSWTTGSLYPMLLIEDLECKKTHFFEVLPYGNWYMEIVVNEGSDGKGKLNVFLGGGNMRLDGWHITLQSGERYETIPGVYGTVDGGFEAAVAALIRYKRETSVVHYANNIPPACFNDYMNCCWGKPGYEKTLRLIDAAVDAGAEVFCMDAGWQASLLDDSISTIGDWVVARERFLPGSLAEIVRYARDRGLIFGVWLEIERVNERAAGYSELHDHLLTRDGHVILSGGTAVYDFRSPVIQEKMERVFDMLYDMGVRYIKNDYNQTIGIGCDGSACLGEGLRETQVAFVELIDRVLKKHPDMMIENCGSGAMRSDAATLSHFYLQSVSDQEVYTNNPSVVAGSMACIQAEKLGIWAYPYPIRYANRANYEITPEQKEKYANGQETVFNMVNAMLGTMYLSGRIDEADAHNQALIREAIRVYKEIRADIPVSYPIFPQGMFHLGDSGIFSAGNLVPEKKIATLAIWKIRTEETAEIDLSRYGRIRRAVKLYPSEEAYRVEACGDTLRAELPEGDSAVLVQVEFASEADA